MTANLRLHAGADARSRQRPSHGSIVTSQAPLEEVGPASYDPQPLAWRHFTLQDLGSGGLPADPSGQEAEVRRAVAAVRALLADAHGVAVHCGAGIGRTGLVIGAVLVSQGHDPGDVTDWLARVQRARGARGWPESPWQADALATFG